MSRCIKMAVVIVTVLFYDLQFLCAVWLVQESDIY